MSSKDEWDRLMASAGISGVRDLARKASKHLAGPSDINASTISRMIDGSGKRGTSRRVLDAVAKALGVDVDEVDRLHGLSRSEVQPFRPHETADLLTAEERKTVNELIRLLTLRRGRGGEGDGDAAPSKTPAPGPADQPGLSLVAYDDKDRDIDDEEPNET